MTAPAEEHHTVAARRLTAYAVLAHDPAVPSIAADYWEKSTDHYRAVDGALRAFLDRADDTGQARAAYRSLTEDPADWPRHAALRDSLRSLLATCPEETRALAAEAAAADRHIWIDYHLGDRHTGRLPAAEPHRAASATAQAGPAEVWIVIPFRDREGGARTSNLLACLRALADQAEGPGHRVMVVESDGAPRSRALIEPLVDRYVFAPKQGTFNKSWTVNVGAVDARADSLPYLCVLDADILVDRAFVARNVGRLSSGTHGAHLPFRWSLSLDAVSSRNAVELRTGQGAADVPEDVLRGLLLREPPGGCVWLRTETFHRVGGFDERYEGWGGEDDDFAARLAATDRLVRYDDQLLHLDHPRPLMVRDDGTPFNAHVEPMSWRPGTEYGLRDKFTGPA
ncbi:galactosyltransferase-related protein [Streptomyces xiaopingdaonensis]|uniref:galactosyltransferase-related protein n=1 Tax=Streptomyces xiaopingdaonensis TaxID=1565415 RepID=UPI00031418C4|nr:galactosyltransferase-related protein [Streptomyces xiaopingdaonensis]